MLKISFYHTPSRVKERQNDYQLRLITSRDSYDSLNTCCPKISAPTAPKGVTYTVLSPVLARVEWTPDPGLWYELHWRTDDSPSLPHKLKGKLSFRFLL